MKKLLSLLFLCQWGFSFSQFVPKNEIPLMNVEYLKKEGKDEMYVKLEGSILKQIGGEKYLFKDSTGEITVEIDNKVWKGLMINENDLVVIEGELENEIFEKIEIDVKKISLKKDK